MYFFLPKSRHTNVNVMIEEGDGLSYCLEYQLLNELGIDKTFTKYKIVFRQRDVDFIY